MPSSAKSLPEFPFAGWAARLSIALVAALGAVAIFTTVDHARRASLESVSQPTAVGDTHFILPNADAGRPLGLLNGHGLVGNERVKARDSHMIRVGSDDTHSFSLYRLEDPDAAPQKTYGKPRVVYYLKIKSGEYLKVVAQ